MIHKKGDQRFTIQQSRNNFEPRKALK